MGTVSINGKTYTGNNVTITGDSVYIDGKLHDDSNDDSKTINVVVNGDLDSIEVETCNRITVNGDSKFINSKNGNIHASNVFGNIETKNGNINHYT